MRTPVINRLEALYAKKGKLTTAQVLADAAKPRSPLHKEFTWDNSKAANEYRLIQARKLIRRYNVTVQDYGEKFVHIPAIVQNKPGEYKKAKAVVKTISEFERAMAEALSRLSAAKDAVKILENAATLEPEDDRLTLMALALKSIGAAESAIRKLH